MTACADLIAEAATCGVPESKIRIMLAEFAEAKIRNLSKR